MVVHLRLSFPKQVAQFSNQAKRKLSTHMRTRGAFICVKHEFRFIAIEIILVLLLVGLSNARSVRLFYFYFNFVPLGIFSFQPVLYIDWEKQQQQKQQRFKYNHSHDIQRYFLQQETPYTDKFNVFAMRKSKKVVIFACLLLLFFFISCAEMENYFPILSEFENHFVVVVVVVVVPFQPLFHWPHFLASRISHIWSASGGGRFYSIFTLPCVCAWQVQSENCIPFNLDDRGPRSQRNLS